MNESAAMKAGPRDAQGAGVPRKLYTYTMGNAAASQALPTVKVKVGRPCDQIQGFILSGAIKCDVVDNDPEVTVFAFASHSERRAFLDAYISNLWIHSTALGDLVQSNIGLGTLRRLIIKSHGFDPLKSNLPRVGLSVTVEGGTFTVYYQFLIPFDVFANEEIRWTGVPQVGHFDDGGIEASMGSCSFNANSVAWVIDPDHATSKAAWYVWTRRPDVDKVIEHPSPLRYAIKTTTENEAIGIPRGNYLYLGLHGVAAVTGDGYGGVKLYANGETIFDYTEGTPSVLMSMYRTTLVDRNHDEGLRNTGATSNLDQPFADAEYGIPIGWASQADPIGGMPTYQDAQVWLASGFTGSKTFELVYIGEPGTFNGEGCGDVPAKGGLEVVIPPKAGAVPRSMLPYLSKRRKG
jgi:hypothetical protein